jgi:hypothetical protein
MVGSKPTCPKQQGKQIMTSIRSLLFGKKKITSLTQDELHRLVLLGENKERSLQRQIDAHEKTKENLFHSVTHAPSTDRQKRFTAQKMAALENSIQGLERTLRAVSVETRIVQRAMETNVSKSRRSESSLLDKFSIEDLTKRMQQIAVDEQLRDERHNEIQSACEGANETYSLGESARVMEIFRQIVEVSDANLGSEPNLPHTESSVMHQRSSHS